MASEKDIGQPGSTKGRQSRVRVNSAKVTPLSDDSWVEAVEQSKFSRWRARRAEAASVSPAEDNTLTPPQSVQGRKLRRMKRWGYLLLTGLVLAALFIGLVFYSPLLATRTITVEGTSLLQRSEVEQSLQPLHGRPLTRVTQQEVVELIGESHLVRTVSIEARPPHELVVTVQERVPVAVVKNGGGYELVDAEGVQLGSLDSAEAAGVPLVDGGTDILSSEVYATVSSVLESLPAGLLSRVREAKADSASTISLVMSDGVQVVWGSSSDNELKAKVLTELMASVGGDGSVSTYDVSSPTVPTTK